MLLRSSPGDPAPDAVADAAAAADGVAADVEPDDEDAAGADDVACESVVVEPPLVDAAGVAAELTDDEEADEDVATATAAVVVLFSRDGVRPPLLLDGLERTDELPLAVDDVGALVRLVWSRSVEAPPRFDDAEDDDDVAAGVPPPPPPSPWLLCGMLRFGVMAKPVFLGEATKFGELPRRSCVVLFFAFFVPGLLSVF